MLQNVEFLKVQREQPSGVRPDGSGIALPPERKFRDLRIIIVSKVFSPELKANIESQEQHKEGKANNVSVFQFPGISDRADIGPGP